MSKLFGTDGIRGIVGKDLTEDLATKIGSSVSKVLKDELQKENLTFLVGSDTRASKDMFTKAISLGVIDQGCSIIDVGVLPTPAISYLTKKYELDGAFVISASHNPSEYNGIKVLDKNGFKLDEKLEKKCEEIILSDKELESSSDIGMYSRNKRAFIDYVDYLLSTFDGDLRKLRILVDTANGASYRTANIIFSRLYASGDIINNTPNGYNINENSGSTHIDTLKEKVVNGGYDVGIAYDGDADRCILVDELGNEIDGDFILAIAGLDLKKQNKLANNTIVGTVMSNLGFVKFCKENDINFVDTQVGDKYVLEEMLKNEHVLGGEQSGHIIFKEHANTGDGELTSLQILNIMTKTGKKLSELASCMKKYPQVLMNLEATKEQKEEYKKRTDIHNVIKEYEKGMNGEGRILVRPSGTENLIRVMIEGKDIEEITKLCNEIVDYLRKELTSPNKTYKLKQD